MVQPAKVGAGLVLLHLGQVFLVMERQTNLATGKRAGQYSIPLETSMEGEDPDNPNHTLSRLLNEEVGRDVQLTNLRFIDHFVLFEGRAVAGIFVADFVGATALGPLDPEELEYVGWTPRKVLQTLQWRDGVYDILQSILAKIDVGFPLSSANLGT